MLWWQQFDYPGGCPELSLIAQVLLCLLASSAAVERSFSNLDFIHSALRNRLCPPRRAKLLMIYYNIRALWKDRVKVVGKEEFRVTAGTGQLVVTINS